jgi:hypothetical protein
MTETCNKHPPAREWTIRIMFWAVAVLFAYYFASLRFAKPEWGPCSLEMLSEGKGNTPFQYRVLVPWIVHWASLHVLPLPGIGTGRGLAFIIEIGCTFGLVVAFRHYLGYFFRGLASRTLLTSSLLLVLPFNLIIPRIYPFWLVYDVPAVLFMTLGMILIYRRQWWIYYPLFVLATFNRETTCFLTLIYLLTAFDRDRPVKLAAHAIAQAGIWFGIKTWLGHLYAANPGAGFAVKNLMTNLHNMTTDPACVMVTLSSMGFLWLPVLVYYRRIGDPFVRRSSLIAPVFLFAMFLVANVPEIRLYAEMIPVVLPAFLLILKDAMTEEAHEAPHRAA